MLRREYLTCVRQTRVFLRGHVRPDSSGLYVTGCHCTRIALSSPHMAKCNCGDPPQTMADVDKFIHEIKRDKGKRFVSRESDTTAYGCHRVTVVYLTLADGVPGWKLFCVKHPDKRHIGDVLST